MRERCKYQELCKELYPEGEERRKSCDNDHCERYDNFYEGECMALEAD